MAAAPQECDLAVVGGGILGLAVARELTRRRPGLDAVVLEHGPAVAGGQTGSNSGVIHAGIYYMPGSLKARLCVEGAREMYEFCEAKGIEHERCGKLIVARDESELGRLDELERRGHENQVPGLRRLSAGEISEIEPHCRGAAALHSPNTGIVDFAAVARALAQELSDAGTPVALDHGIRSVSAGNGRIALTHAEGETRARFAVFCAGTGSDKLAVAAGAPADPRIVPFRGAYLYLKPDKAPLVRSMPAASRRSSPGTPFARPRRASSTRRGSSACESATISFPQRSCAIPRAAQNAYISRAPSTHSRAFRDPGA